MIHADLYLDHQSIDTTTPMGKLMFQVAGAFAEFERGMASESDGGVTERLTFTRVIVWPDGRREVEGKTPKQIEHKSSHALPSEDIVDVEPSDINDLDD